jgi:hypothetical protein
LETSDTESRKVLDEKFERGSGKGKTALLQGPVTYQVLVTIVRVGHNEKGEGRELVRGAGGAEARGTKSNESVCDLPKLPYRLIALLGIGMEAQCRGNRIPVVEIVKLRERNDRVSNMWWEGAEKGNRRIAGGEGSRRNPKLKLLLSDL